jgi:hypothetical protein
VLVVVSAVLIGGITWAVRQLTPDHPTVLIGYWPEADAPLPWTAPDREALLALGFAPPASGPALANDPQQLGDALDALARSGAPDRPVVLYLRAPIETDEEGVRLNPGRTPHRGPRLRTVLEQFRACGGKNKLLILEVVWADLHPAAAADRFPDMRAVLKELEAVPDPDRSVLASCGPRSDRAPEQTSHNSVALGRSVFGYYLEQGLRGAADGWNRDRSTDQRVTVRELYAYLQDRLRAWSRANRLPEQEQEPWLGGPAAQPDGDFPILRVSPRAPAESPAPALDEFPGWLRGAWDLRDSWRAEGTNLSAPRLFRTLQVSILEAEWEWRHGVPAPETRLQSAVERLKQEHNRDRAAAQTPPVEGVPVLDPVPIADIKADAVVKKLLEAVPAPPGAVPPGAGPTGAAPAPDLPLPPGEVVARGVKALLSSPGGPTPDQVARLARLIPDPPPSPLALFVRRLARSHAPNAPWPIDQVRNLLRVVQEADAEFGRRPLYPGLLRRADAAAQAVHDAEVLFFARGYATSGDVDRAIAAAEQALGALRAERSELETGEETLNRAAAVLVDTAETALRSPEVADAWLRSANEAARLAELYLPAAGGAGPRPAAGPPADLLRSSRTLQDEVRGLARRFETSAVADVIYRCNNRLDTPGQLADAAAVFASPLALAPDRSELWKAGFALTKRLQGTTAPPAPSGPPVAGQTLVSRSAAAATPDRDLTRLRTVRERGRSWFAPMRIGGLTARDLIRTDGASPLDTMPDGPERDFLGRVVAPPPLNESERTLDPTRGWALRREAAWSRWLAARFRYERQDPVTSGAADEMSERAHTRWSAALEASAQLAERAAGERARGWEAPHSRQGIRFLTPPPAVSAGPDGQKEALTLEFQALGGFSAVPPATVFLDDRWFRLADAPGLGTVTSVGVARISDDRFRITLPFTARPGGLVPPAGMLVRVSTADGLSFHQRVGVSLGAPAGFRFLVTADPKASAGVPLGSFRVRPLAGQKFHLALSYGGRGKRTVVVALEAGGTTRLSKPITLSEGEPAPVEFPPAAPPATGPAPGPPPPLAAPQPLAAPFALIVSDPDDPGRELHREEFRPAVMEPREYVPGHEFAFEPAGPTGQPRVRLELRARPGLSGPPPAAELAFPAERNPFLAPVTAGTLAGPVPTDGSPLLLFADGVRVGGTAAPVVVADVTIDGVQRALRYRVPAAAAGREVTAVRDLAPAVRVVAPIAARSGTALPVQVEQDNVPGGSRMELSLLRPEGELLVPEAGAARTAGRVVVVQLADAPGPAGAFTISAALQDRMVELPTGKALGRRVLRARLLDASGRELAVHEQSVILDDRPPADVRFLLAPRQAGQGTVLSVRATATAPISGVREVRFALGRPVNGKLPDAVARIAGKPSAADPSVWEAKVPVPPDLLGSVELQAEFVSGVGVSGTASADVEVLTAAEAAKPKPATIRGVVVEGEYFRADLDVVLTDDKGAEKGKSKTDEKGRFVFENLPPGKYTLSSAKPDGTRKGSTPVEVKPGETAQVKVELYL